MRELLNDFATWLAKKTYTPPKVEFVTQIEGVQKWAPIKNSSHFIPDWFKKLPFDEVEMEKKVVDKKVHNLLNVLKWDFSQMQTSNTFHDLFSFSD